MTHNDTMCVEAGGIIQLLPIPNERGVALDLWTMNGQVAGHTHVQLSAAEVLEIIARLEMSLLDHPVPPGWRGVSV